MSVSVFLLLFLLDLEIPLELEMCSLCLHRSLVFDDSSPLRWQERILRLGTNVLCYFNYGSLIW